MSSLYSLARLARPTHWMKNLFVLAALVFARRVTDGASWVAALEAFAVFCLASSGVYALNDVVDRREDARHPAKKDRPVASGAVSAGAAVAMGVLLIGAAVGLAFLVRWPFPLTVGAYLVLMAGYLAGLKRVAVLDVLLLAVGFVLRACAGAVAIDVEVSPWLVLCTLTLSLFLGFAKRESERVALGAAAGETRLVEWRLYDEKSLEHMMAVSASLAVVTYLLYTVDPRTVQHVGSPWMFITVLPVLFAVFRFYRLAITGRATGPVEMVRRDVGFVLALAVWLVLVVIVLFGLKGSGGPGLPV